MSKKRKKKLSNYCCCEICNNCTVDNNDDYICNKNQATVIKGYLPTEDYFGCEGDMFLLKRT